VIKMSEKYEKNDTEKLKELLSMYDIKYIPGHGFTLVPKSDVAESTIVEIYTIEEEIENEKSENPVYNGDLLEDEVYEVEVNRELMKSIEEGDVERLNKMSDLASMVYELKENDEENMITEEELEMKMHEYHVESDVSEEAKRTIENSGAVMVKKISSYLPTIIVSGPSFRKKETNKKEVYIECEDEPAELSPEEAKVDPMGKGEVSYNPNNF